LVLGLCVCQGLMNLILRFTCSPVLDKESQMIKPFCLPYSSLASYIYLHLTVLIYSQAHLQILPCSETSVYASSHALANRLRLPGAYQPIFRYKASMSVTYQ